MTILEKEKKEDCRAAGPHRYCGGDARTVVESDASGNMVRREAARDNNEDDDAGAR